MATAARIESTVQVVAEEQRMLIHGVSWKDYVLLREALDTPGLRMTYYRGALELMSPSKTHELNKKTIARLLEAYSRSRRLGLVGYGSTTFRKEVAEAGAEPDECYCVRRTLEAPEFPDIVLEVIHKSPLLDKLAVYRRFAVAEVWIFQSGGFEIYLLGADGYARAERSARLPELDFAMLARFATREDQEEAIDEFLAAVAR